jgi:hypothetical protein
MPPLAASITRSSPARFASLPALTSWSIAAVAGCGGERSYAITALGACYGDRVTVADVLRQMRCARGCGGRPLAAWLVTGPILNERIRPRRVSLIGPEARD